ncbi:hypothetical protein [Pleurocapsa sp. PCC 7319]|uniref:pyroglutamyl-peptidase I family protein n=1 Tax=Pleurocapsa sp. PCC 7319 TaxID=118161 RepID=UPI00036F056B|nr:hypothetical protein [Pleurocapsa sp. PCC 7319]
MSTQLLLTSFQIWLPHQKSNSSDDLLEIIQKQQLYLDSLFFLRKLPVNKVLAAQKAIETIEKIKPQGVICCGMAESRDVLTVESNAVCKEKCIFTNVNLDALVTCLTNTKISNNAGRFVCEELYYQVLHYIQIFELNINCIFVHIPILTPNNIDNIQQDFINIIKFMKCNAIS